jgi:hypothetical protein
VHICLRFGEREESRLYKDLVNILENLHIRRYVSVSQPRYKVAQSANYAAIDANMSQQYGPAPNP